MLLVSITVIPTVNAQEEDNFTDSEYYLPDYGPSVFEKFKDDLDVIATRGVVPEITDNNEKVKWLDIIETSMRSSKDELEPYMQQHGGPVIGFNLIVLNKLSSGCNYLHANIR